MSHSMQQMVSINHVAHDLVSPMNERARVEHPMSSDEMICSGVSGGPVELKFHFRYCE